MLSRTAYSFTVAQAGGSRCLYVISDVTSDIMPNTLIITLK